MLNDRGRPGPASAGGALLTAALLAACAGQSQPSPLPRLAIDPDRVAVAGLSSGAYMAAQAHLALNSRIHGAALIAGGPYGCAAGSLEQALGPCMKASPQPPEPAALAAMVRERVAAGKLPPLDALAHDRVLVLHGQGDTVVAAPVAMAAVTLYRHLGIGLSAPIELTVDTEREFGHTLPTPDAGSDCATGGAPFLGRCGFDAAGQVFDVLFADVPAAPPAPTGALQPFDQRPYRPTGGDPQLAELGYLYVPTACADGVTCGLLTVFHGCDQHVDAVGEAFVRDAGFNRWADAADVVVLYPQVRASFVPLNPKGCWDWWGYTGPDYDTRNGAQLRWLDAALTALGVPAE